MTEQDAKQKWCPFVRLVQGGRVNSNRGDGSYSELTHCLGTGCMAWRSNGETDGGFCGLAGHPGSGVPLLVVDIEGHATIGGGGL